MRIHTHAYPNKSYTLEMPSGNTSPTSLAVRDLVAPRDMALFGWKCCQCRRVAFNNGCDDCDNCPHERCVQCHSIHVPYETDEARVALSGIFRPANYKHACQDNQCGGLHRANSGDGITDCLYQTRKNSHLHGFCDVPLANKILKIDNQEGYVGEGHGCMGTM